MTMPAEIDEPRRCKGRHVCIQELIEECDLNFKRISTTYIVFQFMGEG